MAVFTLKPVTGSASTHGGFCAEVATGKGDVVGIDGVIAEAINYGYINGIKPESAKGDGRHGVVMHLRSPSGDRPSVNPRIISATDSRIHCAWPEELSGEEFLGMLCEVVVYKLPPQEDPLTYPRREIKAVIVQA